MFGEWGIGKRQRGRGAGSRGERKEAEGQGERSRGERGNFVFSPLPPTSSSCQGLIATTATKTLE